MLESLLELDSDALAVADSAAPPWPPLALTLALARAGPGAQAGCYIHYPFQDLCIAVDIDIIAKAAGDIPILGKCLRIVAFKTNLSMILIHSLLLRPKCRMLRIIEHPTHSNKKNKRCSLIQTPKLAGGSRDHAYSRCRRRRQGWRMSDRG